jgi:phosphoribosylformylglycinamidine synthase
MNRFFIQKKPHLDAHSDNLTKKLYDQLNLDVQVFLMKGYEIESFDSSLINQALTQVLSEPMSDVVFTQLPKSNGSVFIKEPLPGQFDQRAESTLQCLKLMDVHTKATVKTFEVASFNRVLNDEETLQFLSLWINPIESRLKNLDEQSSMDERIIDDGFIEDFTSMSESQLISFLSLHSAAMSLEDIKLIQAFFRDHETRQPTMTEFKVLDTYWSDHCRHTTFETHLDQIVFEVGPLKEVIQNTFEDYKALRSSTKRTHKPITLMDMATIAAKAIQDERVDLSDEVNACSVKVKLEDHNNEEWLIQFKNETHNHPTEIEPFGGASTCIGGAIRDPLSGRAYVYQAMRISGCGDVRENVSQTLSGKLPQIMIATQATAGNSSYGNQIGVATTTVKEIYHPSYKTKHLELGAVVGAVKSDHVVRLQPQPGDVILLLGGKTGRDGIGGATGSSVEHHDHSLIQCAAQVQKGNAVEERQLQRLFRNPDFSKRIKKCNDFGAGGVSVAIGELASGLDIDLSLIPLKYQGLNATELAISESQERMAIVIDSKDIEQMIHLANEENVEATLVAHVNDSQRLVMKYQDRIVVDLSRKLIDTHGAQQHVNVRVDTQGCPPQSESFSAEWALKHMASLNVSSQKGLIEHFDSSINALSVVSPLGGKHQLTPSMGSVSFIPHPKSTSMASILTYGFIPRLSEGNMYVSAQGAVLESIAKVIACGGQIKDIFFSFQEYFPKLKQDTMWGEVVSALLGALSVQTFFQRPAIGGKDSMSGSFKDMDVLPTLVSFACSITSADKVITSQAKHRGNMLYLLKVPQHPDGNFNLQVAKTMYKSLENAHLQGCVKSAYVVKESLFASCVTMLAGNHLGMNYTSDLDITRDYPASIIVESSLDMPGWIPLGTISDDLIINHQLLNKAEIFEAFKSGLDFIYPRFHQSTHAEVTLPRQRTNIKKYPFPPVKEVNVIIPLFPGTNCEDDTKRAFEKAGGVCEIVPINTLTPERLLHSIDHLTNAIDKAHILVLAGGFSMGDEPDGSAKFIVNIIRNESIKAAITRLIERKGLILGICNGFQALIKSGLLPYGEIKDLTTDDATLTFNALGRHISTIVSTRLVSDHSPWLQGMSDEVIKVPLSHGEGRLIASDTMIKTWIDQKQIAFQMCDENAQSWMDADINVNGSVMAIEGLISPCGHILGKMGHTERVIEGCYQNIEGFVDCGLFENGIRYFKNTSEAL